jgi:uncharacterized protein (DUF2132 family)
MKAPIPPAAKNQLHGLTLEVIVKDLVAYFGWEELGRRVAIRCFIENPSVTSSLKFLRKTPWAREKVEGLYLFMQRERAREQRRASLLEAPAEQAEAPADEGLVDDGSPGGEREPPVG